MYDTYFNRLLAKYYYGPAAACYVSKDEGSTVQATSQNPTERVSLCMEIPENRKMAEGPDKVMDSKLYIYYACITTPKLSTWTEPNIYDCLFSNMKLYETEMQDTLKANRDAFFKPSLYYYKDEMNEEIASEPCVVRNNQLFMGVEINALTCTDEETKEISDYPLYQWNSTYLCKVQVDMDHGDYVYVGAEVELKGHLMCVPGDLNTYPPITKKVRIKTSA